MKAFGMFTIIWGHIMLYGISNAIVYAFHIPLFFFLSGLMFKTAKYPSFTNFFVKRIKSLIIPYIIYSVLFWLVWVAYNWFSNAEVEDYLYPLWQTFIAQGSAGFLLHDVPLWFVTCLFVVEILYFFISKLKHTLKIIVCVMCGIIGFLMTLDNPIINFKLLPWNIEVALAAIPFYAIGNYLVETYSHSEIINKINNNKKTSLLVFVFSIIMLYVGASLNGSVSMGSNHLNNFFLFYMTAFFGILAMLIFCVFLSSLNKNFVSNFIIWFGMNSFTCMAIHYPLKGIVEVLLFKYLFDNSTTIVPDTYLESFIIFLSTLLLTCVLMILINHVKSVYAKLMSRLVHSPS